MIYKNENIIALSNFIGYIEPSKEKAKFEDLLKDLDRYIELLNKNLDSQLLKNDILKDLLNELIEKI